MPTGSFKCHPRRLQGQPLEGEMSDRYVMARPKLARGSGPSIQGIVRSFVSPSTALRSVAVSVPRPPLRHRRPFRRSACRRRPALEAVAAFLAAGKHVVDNCETLIAIWTDGPRAGSVDRRHRSLRARQRQGGAHRVARRHRRLIDQGAARYGFPGRTVTVFPRPKSRTRTLPLVTVVSVPSHRSSVLHSVPYDPPTL